MRTAESWAFDCFIKVTKFKLYVVTKVDEALGKMHDNEYLFHFFWYLSIKKLYD